MGKYCGCKGKCRCGKSRDIVYPTREEVKNRYTEETVRHIYPTHTKYVNNHTVRNEYYYPHTQSYENRCREVDVRGARDRGPGGRVAGARSPYDDYGRGGYGGGGKGCGCGCGSRGRCGGRRGGFWC